MKLAGSARAAAALVLALVAGCSTDDADQGAKESPSAETSEQSPSAEGAEESPRVDTLVNLDRPRLTIELPAYWRESSLQDTRDQIAEEAEGLPPGFRESYLELVEQIDDGVIVAHAVGPPVANGSHSPTILVSVESGDASLRAAAERREAFLRSLAEYGLRHHIDERAEVPLPLGEAIRITAHSDPAGGIPSQTIEYVLLLDELTVSILGTAPAAYRQFVEVMDTLAEGLRRS